MTDHDLTDLPRLPLDAPEALDRAVEHAFWLLRGLEQTVRASPADDLPDEDERARRRSRMRALSARLGACVGTSPAAAPQAVRPRRG